MEREYEGFSRAVKAVMQAGRNLGGIHGPVANLMRTEGTYSLAIEIALGGALQNIVVDREEDARNAIRYLKQRDAGRATFLPLTAIHGEELRQRGVEQEPGFVGLASRRVRFEERYQRIFWNLLGRTVVVEDLDAGIAIARKYRNAFRIVTLDGQVINRGGSMTGGSVSRGTGVLSRSAELETLRQKGAELRRRLEQAQSEEDLAARELAVAEYDLENAETDCRKCEDEALKLEGSQRHYELLLDSLRETIGNQAGLREQLAGQAEECRGKADALKARIDACEAEAADFHRQGLEAAQGHTELLAEAARLNEEIAAWRELLASLTAERDGAVRRAADLRKLAEDLSGDRAAREASLREYEDGIRSSEEEIARHREEIERLAGEAETYQETLRTLNREKLALEAERTARSRESQEKNEHLLNLERAVSKLEQKRNAGAMEEKQILDRLWETYQLSHSDAETLRQDLPSVPKANRRAGELKREIHALGNVNIGAIEEFERVNTRYSYLTTQRDDVEKARRELLGIIDAITAQMTDIFTRQFQLLSKSFQATFVELFGGGAAKLELEDPADVLNCGIEIKAQPPGKTLKTISLLSGGEKAFVAIALYFSILKVHPTPFCVMDEIEAALDDANVTRYARYMRRLTEHTQFIVITHRRGTMEEADVLYGVTMQEQGVSKVLTINLNDMEKELKLA